MEILYNKLINEIYTKKVNFKNIKLNKFYIYLTEFEIIYLGKILEINNKIIVFEYFKLNISDINELYYSNKSLNDQEQKFIDLLKENTKSLIYSENEESFIKIILNRDRIGNYVGIYGFKLEHTYGLDYEEIIEINNEQLAWTDYKSVSPNIIGETDILILSLKN